MHLVSGVPPLSHWNVCFNLQKASVLRAVLQPPNKQARVKWMYSDSQVPPVLPSTPVPFNLRPPCHCWCPTALTPEPCFDKEFYLKPQPPSHPTHPWSPIQSSFVIYLSFLPGLWLGGIFGFDSLEAGASLVLPVVPVLFSLQHMLKVDNSVFLQQAVTEKYVSK